MINSSISTNENKKLIDGINLEESIFEKKDIAMSKIKIKNFGPIKEGYIENDGWIDVKKVTVFIGNQGSGKSTVAKLLQRISEPTRVGGIAKISWFGLRAEKNA